MGVARSTILRGPAIVQMGGQSFYAKDGIKCTFGLDTFPINSDAYGKVDERIKDFTVKLTFTPVGMWTAALLAVLYPYTNPVTGTSLFTASDVPVTIHPLNGAEKIVFTAGAVTKMPGLKLSAVETTFKEMEITCLIGTGLDHSNAAALYTLSDLANFTDSSFAVASIKTVPYTASLAGGSSPWDSIKTEAGFEADFDLKTSPVAVDSVGLVDYSIQGLDISIKLKPIGMTVSQVLTKMLMQGTGAARGVSLSTSGADLTITGTTSGTPVVTFETVRLKNAGQIYDNTNLRHDTIEFVVTRPTGSGAMFTVGVVA